MQRYAEKSKKCGTAVVQVHRLDGRVAACLFIKTPKCWQVQGT